MIQDLSQYNAVLWNSVLNFYNNNNNNNNSSDDNDVDEIMLIFSDTSAVLVSKYLYLVCTVISVSSTFYIGTVI